jgi:hypothetical protein
VRERLLRWFARPAADAPPSETLRWVRRMTAAMTLVAALTWLRQWLLGDENVSLVAGCAGLLLLSWLLQGLVVRRAVLREGEQHHSR